MCDPGSQAKHGGSIAVKMVLTDCFVHLVWALLWTLPALVVYPFWDQTFIMLIALWIVLEHKLLRACQVDSVFSLAIGNSQTCKFVLLLLRTQASVWCVQWCGADCFKAVCDRTAFEKVLLHHPQVRPWNDSGNTNLVITTNLWTPMVFQALLTWFRGPLHVRLCIARICRSWDIATN